VWPLISAVIKATCIVAHKLFESNPWQSSRLGDILCKMATTSKGPNDDSDTSVKRGQF
jgi:hypothetical protein